MHAAAQGVVAGIRKGSPVTRRSGLQQWGPGGTFIHGAFYGTWQANMTGIACLEHLYERPGRLAVRQA